MAEIHSKSKNFLAFITKVDERQKMLISTSHSDANWMCMEAERLLITGLKDQVFISWFRYPWYFIICLVLSREKSQASESMHPEVSCLSFLAGGRTFITYVLIIWQFVQKLALHHFLSMTSLVLLSSDILRSTQLQCFTFKVFWSLACFKKVRTSRYMLFWRGRTQDGREEKYTSSAKCYLYHVSALCEEPKSCHWLESRKEHKKKHQSTCKG